MSKLIRPDSHWHRLFRQALHSRLGSNILSLYAVRGLNYLVPLILLPYLLRALGPIAYGSIAFAQAFIGYMGVLTDFGFNLSATREISRCRDQPEAVARIFWSTFAAQFGLLIAGTLVLLPAAWFVPVIRQHAPVVALSGLAVIGSVLLPQWYFQGLERMRAMAIIQGASKLVMLLAVLLLVHSPHDELKAAALLTIPFLLGGALCLLSVPLVAPVRWYRPSRLDMWQALRSSWHLFISGAAANLYVNSNVFLLGLICGDYQVGLYSLANRMTLAAFGVLGPVAQAAYPRASLLFSRSVAEGKAFVLRLSRYLLVLGAGLSLVEIAFARELVALFGGARYMEALPVLRVMALLPLVLTVATLLAQIVMINLGLERSLSKIYIGAGLLNLGLLPVLASRFGALGGAESLVIIELIGPVLMALTIRRSQALRTVPPGRIA